MSILINGKTKLIIQGITTEKGSFYTRQMIGSGVQIVAGVSPGQGGDWILNEKIPVFDSVDAAVDATGADASIVFVPADGFYDAITESIFAEIPIIFGITGQVPLQDTLKIKEQLQTKSIRFIGPGSPGMITSENLSIGVVPPNISVDGDIGVVSRSGPIAFQIINEMRQAGLGISSFVGIGSDEILGSDFCDILNSFELDPMTEKILIIGEGNTIFEEKAAEYINDQVTKPVFGYVEEKTILDKDTNTVLNKNLAKSERIIEKKINALESAGVRIAALSKDIPTLINSV